MATKRGLSRRDFLRVGTGGLLGAAGLSLLAACAPAAPPPPAAPTSAPAPAAAASPAAGATAAPAAKPEAAKPGANLIGKLEGPTVITDPAQFPKTFKEAPMLAEQVTAGKLPPVEQRVSQDPLVIKPLNEIGKYGGTWRRGFTGPGDQWNGFRAASGPDHVLFWDHPGDKVVPNIARGYEVQDGGKTFVIQLRRGMKWSDGTPFTADAFVFWYEDMFQNKELYPTPTSTMTINGKLGKMDKVDDSTVRFVFPEPYYLFPEILAGSTPLSSHSYFGDPSGAGCFAPAHYLKQFHPKYAGKEAVDKLTADNKFDNWVALFKAKNRWQLNPDLPVATAWKTTSPANTPTWTLERNPYSIWVDTDGNQLPYIDKVSLGLAENIEVINLRAIAGEYDVQERHLDIGKLPVFIENQQKGNYTLHLDPGDYGADGGIKFNLSFDGDPEIGKWIGTTDFRRALALGIDRDQINETFWLGTAVPGSAVPVDTNKYNPGPEWRKKWAVLDVKQANDMLDKLGLDKKDSEGFRQRTDGKGRLSLTVTTWAGQFVQWTRICEMVRDQWKKIGIDLQVQEVERTLGQQRFSANENQMWAWNNDGSEHLFTFPDHVFPFLPIGGGGALYAQWFQSNGEQGKEPPPKLKELMDNFRKAFGVPEDERVRLGKEIWKTVADEVYMIGIVGMGPASMGVRIAKNNMGNIPSRMYNSPDGKTPSNSRTVTFFYKS